MEKRFVVRFWKEILCIMMLVIVSILVHVTNITEIPNGTYSDEVSVAVNAYNIAYTGVDEHGEYMPLYFQAFGEYKNPVYIYSLAALIKLFGPSVFLLRFTSALWFFAFQIGLFFLLRKYFQSIWAGIAGVLIATVFPLIFPLSRVSFELVSQLATLVWALFFGYSAYTSDAYKRRVVYLILSMLFFVLSFFAYSTGKLLIPAFLLLWWCIYLMKRGWKETLLQMALALLFVSPVFFFIASHPGAFTARFDTLTYLQDPDLSLLGKIQTFFEYYRSYFSLDFWVQKGDINLRHHTGLGGMAFISILAITLVGIVKGVITKKPKAFEILLLVFLFLTPVAAALTEPHHALRVHIMVIFLIFFAVKGLMEIMKIRVFMLNGILCLIFFLGFVVEAGRYTHDYFSAYSLRSAAAFETGNLDRSFIAASAYNPAHLIVETKLGDLYMQQLYTFFFYRFLPELQEKTLPEVHASTEGLEHYCRVYKVNPDSAEVPRFEVYCQ